jgi:hypothetical protein
MRTNAPLPAIHVSSPATGQLCNSGSNFRRELTAKGFNVDGCGPGPTFPDHRAAPSIHVRASSPQSNPYRLEGRQDSPANALAEYVAAEDALPWNGFTEPVRATWAMNSPHAKLVIISKDGSVRIMRLTRAASCRMYDLHFDLPLDRGLPVGMDARDRIQSLQLSLTRDSPINRWEILRPRSRRGAPQLTQALASCPLHPHHECKKIIHLMT